MRVTDRQVRKLFMEYQKSGKIQMAALKAGMNRGTAADYIGSGQLPSERDGARDWRTRQDPFAAHWAEAEAMLREAPELEAKASPGPTTSCLSATCPRPLTRWSRFERA